MSRSSHPHHHLLVSVGLAGLLFLWTGSHLMAQAPAGSSNPEEPGEPLPAGLVVDTVADRLAWPIALAFTPDGRLFFTEKGGHGGERPATVWTIAPGERIPQPFATLQVATRQERGLLGIAVDPDYEQNHFIYAFYTHANPLSSRVIRWRDENNQGVEPEIILEIPYVVHEDRPNERHVGGNIHFGPDGTLFVSVGDHNFPSYAQSLDSLAGKILRVNRDGSAAHNNPWYSSSTAVQSKVYALGFRNPWDFTFDPFSGNIFATENGDWCNDEINRVEAGGNYGWPITAPCASHPPGTIPPLITYTPTIAPTGIAVYTGTLIPAWHGDLFFCDFNTGTLRHATLNARRTAITAVTRVRMDPRCEIDLVVGPEGALYFTSWKGFGSGSIYRISRLRLRQTIDQPTAIRGQQRTYTLEIAGSGPERPFVVQDLLPAGLSYVPGSAETTTGTVETSDNQLIWQGVFRENTAMQLQFQTTITTPAQFSGTIENEATLSIDSVRRKAWTRLFVNPFRQYLPVMVQR